MFYNCELEHDAANWSMTLRKKKKLILRKVKTLLIIEQKTDSSKNFTQVEMAISVGAVEYTDTISAVE